MSLPIDRSTLDRTRSLVTGLLDMRLKVEAAEAQKAREQFEKTESAKVTNRLAEAIRSGMTGEKPNREAVFAEAVRAQGQLAGLGKHGAQAAEGVAKTLDVFDKQTRQDMSTTEFEGYLNAAGGDYKTALQSYQTALMERARANQQPFQPQIVTTEEGVFQTVLDKRTGEIKFQRMGGPVPRGTGGGDQSGGKVQWRLTRFDKGAQETVSFTGTPREAAAQFKTTKEQYISTLTPFTQYPVEIAGDRYASLNLDAYFGPATPEKMSAQAQNEQVISKLREIAQNEEEITLANGSTVRITPAQVQQIEDNVKNLQSAAYGEAQAYKLYKSGVGAAPVAPEGKEQQADPETQAALQWYNANKSSKDPATKQKAERVGKVLKAKGLLK